MESNLENSSTHQNVGSILNYTDGLRPISTGIVSNIPFGLGLGIMILNIITMCFLLRHKTCINGNGFWQQLVFLCSTDILSGLAMAFPAFGQLFKAVNTSVYYSFCTTGLILLLLSITMSVGNCLMIGVLRYMVMKYIDKPTTTWYKNTTYIMIFGNVLLSVVTVCSSLLVITVHFGFRVVEFCDKMYQPSQNDYKSKYIASSVTMLLMFLIGTNIFTILCILKLRSMRRVQPEVTSTSGSSAGANRYATVTYIIVAFALNLATVPSLLFMLASTAFSGNIPDLVAELISLIISMNSLFNPFIYSLRAKQFRSAVLKDIRKILCIADWRAQRQI